MRRFLLPFGVLAAGCAAEAPGPGAADSPVRPLATARLPSPLRRLILNEGHPTAFPVEFDHALHAAGAPGTSCSSCHHELRQRPAAVPSACTACHVPFYMAPKVDESAAHRHDLPPDL